MRLHVSYANQAFKPASQEHSVPAGRDKTLRIRRGRVHWLYTARLRFHLPPPTPPLEERLRLLALLRRLPAAGTCNVST
jgi:hypothetical protein